MLRITTKRSAAAIIAASVLAVLVAACSASPSSTGPGSTGTAANSPLLGYSQCMRSHGIANFPDPQTSSQAKFPGAEQLGVSDATYQSAETTCQHLLPAGVNDQFPAAEVRLLLSGMLTFSQCMRAHGVPNWPDPSIGPGGRPVFELSAHGFTDAQAHSHELMSKMSGCGHLLPSALGGIPIG